GLPDEKARAREGARLVEWALRSFENVRIFAAGDTVVNAPVVMGRGANAALGVDKNIAVTIPIALRNDLKIDVVYDTPLIAPLRKGQIVGSLAVRVPRLQTHEFPLIVLDDMPQAG